LDRDAVEADALADDVAAIREKVGGGSLADDDHGGAGLRLLLGELAALFDLPVVDVEEGGVAALNLRRPVGVLGDGRGLAAELAGRRFDEGKLAYRRDVGLAEGTARAAALVAAAALDAARTDGEEVGADRRDLLVDLDLRPFADRHHHHHRRDADDDA